MAIQIYKKAYIIDMFIMHYEGFNKLSSIGTFIMQFKAFLMVIPTIIVHYNGIYSAS